MEDDTNAPITVCTWTGKPVGTGAPCPFGNECAQFASCPDGSTCNLFECGGNLGECKRDDAACGANADCTIGKCADGSGCTVPKCGVDQCAPLLCITKGVGDAEAYCARPDCASDADCASGYECGVVRDSHAMCGTTPTDAIRQLCGITSPDCIDPSTFGQGNTYFEGSLCLLRKSCMKRKQCAACETDLDCSFVPGQRCVPLAEGKICARGCNSDSDCDLDYACDMADKACKPRFGACAGQGNFCEPCRSDADCGAAETSVVCFQTLSGQRACLDLSFPITCTTDADCPVAPSGRNGRCADGACLLPFDRQQQKETCW